VSGVFTNGSLEFKKPDGTPALTYEGQFKGGKYDGQGTLTWFDDPTKKDFVGTF